MEEVGGTPEAAPARQVTLLGAISPPLFPVASLPQLLSRPSPEQSFSPGKLGSTGKLRERGGTSRRGRDLARTHGGEQGEGIQVLLTRSRRIASRRNLERGTEKIIYSKRFLWKHCLVTSLENAAVLIRWLHLPWKGGGNQFRSQTRYLN